AGLVSWFEAARFVNWLNTSTGSTPAYKFAIQPGEVGYSARANIQLWTISDAGYNPANLFRNSLAKYFLPSAHEWYKAAYYDPTSGVYFDYPTGSDTAPTAVPSGTAAGTAAYGQVFTGSIDDFADITLAGGLSPYGTMGQGGNVFEWEETEFDLVNDITFRARAIRGGGWTTDSFGLWSLSRLDFDPFIEHSSVGFRVASIPEPDDLGDYNHDDSVDAADYVVWRKNSGTSEEYTIWRANFGNMLGSGSAIATSAPEPSTLLLGAMAGLGLLWRRRRAG
ncbi:MAG: SUMF1/EgtB/PvdO family nonheme iron enzyme, partial [Pirellulales bacterium]